MTTKDVAQKFQAALPNFTVVEAEDKISDNHDLLVTSSKGNSTTLSVSDESVADEAQFNETVALLKRGA